jgi:hypothetical protein
MLVKIKVHHFTYCYISHNNADRTHMYLGTKYRYRIHWKDSVKTFCRELVFFVKAAAV